MRKTTIKLPIEEGKLATVRQNRLYDFLADCVADGDLDLAADDLMWLGVGEFTHSSVYEDQDGKYDIFDVELIGEDRVIREIDNWQQQFKTPLN